MNSPATASIRATFTWGCLIAILVSATLTYLGFSRIAEAALINTLQARAGAGKRDGGEYGVRSRSVDSF